jgi:GNAT superfamily N-acetyltransferase
MAFTRRLLRDEKLEEYECWTTYREQWYVKSVVVRQCWRRKGVGSFLMRKIMDRAAAEGVPVTLEATERGEKLYTRLGFHLVERTEDGARMGWASV